MTRRARRATPSSSARPQIVVASAAGSQASRSLPRPADASLACRSSRRTGAARVDFTVDADRDPGAGQPANSDSRGLGAQLLRASRTAVREDRLRRHAALASANGRRQLHPRRARGLAEAAEEHELVAFAPVEPRPASARSRRSPGSPSSAASSTSRSRTRGARRGAALGRPPAERFVGRFDVLHFSDWMYPPQRARRPRDDDPRPRAAPLPAVDASAHPRACTPRKYAHAARTCDLVVRQLRVHRGEVRERSASPRERIRVALSRRRRAFSPEGPSAELGARTCSPSRRSSRARTSRRSSRARSAASCSRRGGAGWGDSPRSTA